MPPIDSAVTKYGSAVIQPKPRNTRQVISSVATVMPDIGFDEEPTSPVNLEDTVTNRKPRITINTAPLIDTSGPENTLSPSCGKSMMASIRTITPTTTHFIDRSWSVLGRLAFDSAEPPRRSDRPPFRPCQMVGILRTSEMMPAIATAPAPI